MFNFLIYEFKFSSNIINSKWVTDRFRWLWVLIQIYNSLQLIGFSRSIVEPIVNDQSNDEGSPDTFVRSPNCLEVSVCRTVPDQGKFNQFIWQYDWVVWWRHHLDRIYGLSFRALRVWNNKKDGFIKRFWFILKYITHFTVYKHGSTGS